MASAAGSDSSARSSDLSKKFQNRLESLTIRSDSIETMSAYVIHHRNDHSLMADSWLRCVQNAPNNEKRLALLYLANDVLQTCRSKKAEAYLKDFSVIMPRALEAFRGSGDDITKKVRRVFEVLLERRVFSESSVNEMLQHLGGAQSSAIRHHHHNQQPSAKPSITAGEIVSERPIKEIISKFKSDVLIEKIRLQADLDTDVHARGDALKTLDIDISDGEILTRMPSKTEGKEFFENFERSYSAVQSYAGLIDKQIENRKKLIEMLEDAEVFYDTQYGEVKKISTVYHKYLGQIRTVIKKVKERRQDLPSPPPPPRQEDMDVEHDPSRMSMPPFPFGGFAPYGLPPPPPPGFAPPLPGMFPPPFIPGMPPPMFMQQQQQPGGPPPQRPQGSMPPGNMPQGSMPPGNMPQGSMPPGNMPPGMIPPGVPPPGFHPRIPPPYMPSQPSSQQQQPQQQQQLFGGYAAPQYTGNSLSQPTGQSFGNGMPVASSNGGQPRPQFNSPQLQQSSQPPVRPPPPTVIIGPRRGFDRAVQQVQQVPAPMSRSSSMPGSTTSAVGSPPVGLSTRFYTQTAPNHSPAAMAAAEAAQAVVARKRLQAAAVGAAAAAIEAKIPNISPLETSATTSTNSRPPPAPMPQAIVNHIATIVGRRTAPEKPDPRLPQQPKASKTKGIPSRLLWN